MTAAAGGGEEKGDFQKLAAGVQYAHVSSSQRKPSFRHEDQVGDQDGVDLGDLMAQLKGLAQQ